MKNYKKSGMIIFLMMSFFARTYAQDTISGSTVTETAALDQKGMSDMNAVSMRFCNSGITETGIQANLYATTRPGKTQRICAMFFNNMETGTNFHVQFSEAIKNEYNNRLCDQDGKDNDFARLVREDFAEMKISVKPHTQSYRTFNLAIPEDTTGDILGCLGYYLDGSLTQKT